MIEIAVLGHGVVGSGVVEVFYKNYESMAAKVKSDMDIKYILDLREFPDSPYHSKFTKNFEDIIQDDDIKIVVEVMGGLEPAYSYVKQCLQKGKSVVTSNKELVAMKGADLLKTARDHNANFLFEASVGGGIPIIRPISQCLAANDITEIVGILNGTTNFILTKMIRDEMRFDDALKLAQELGYAERDPSADVGGDDTCRKICILASLAYGKHVYPKQVYTEGITGIQLEDVEYAASLSMVIKLIGRAKRLENNCLTVTVYPAMIEKYSQLSSVDDVFNAIMVRGDATGDVVFYGKGAGKLPTASAVIADVMDCVKHMKTRKYLFWEDGQDDYVSDYLLNEHKFYVRGNAKQPQVTGQLNNLFGNVRLGSRPHAPENEIAFVTPTMSEKIFLGKTKEMKCFLDDISVIRVADC